MSFRLDYPPTVLKQALVKNLYITLNNKTSVVSYYSTISLHDNKCSPQSTYFISVPSRIIVKINKTSINSMRFHDICNSIKGSTPSHDNPIFKCLQNFNSIRNHEVG